MGICKKGGININDWTVYDHEFPDGKHYIGITSQDINKRWGKNGCGYHNQPVWQAIQYFGWDNIKHSILYENLSIQEAQSKEKELINYFDSNNNGYNCTNGGDHYFEIKLGDEFLSSEELAHLSSYNISGHDVTNRINEHHWTIDKTLNTPLQDKKHLYEYKGNMYSLRELYEIRINKDLTYRQIASRIIRHNWDAERAITQFSSIKKQPFGSGERKYYYQGKYYNSYELSQINSDLNLSSFDIVNRINHHGWDIERAISQPKRKRK